MFKRLLTFLTPNLRDQPLLFGITRKVLLFQTCIVLQVFRNSLKLSRYIKSIFRGWPRNSLMCHFSEKVNFAYLHIANIKILNKFCSIMLFKMFIAFEIFEVTDNPVWAPKIPNYVTYDPKFITNRIILIWSTFLVL